MQSEWWRDPRFLLVCTRVDLARSEITQIGAFSASKHPPRRAIAPGDTALCRTAAVARNELR